LPPEKSFAGVDAPNVILSAMKRSEDGKALIVRLYESAGMQTHARVRVPVQEGAASEADLMEKAGAALKLDKGEVQVEMAPWEIKTLRIEVPVRNGEFWK
jgi:alpha-mannosidase